MPTFDAVFDKRRVSQQTIDSVISPYQIWNSDELGRGREGHTYVLARQYRHNDTEEYNARLDELRKDSNLVIKRVSCGN